MTDSESRGLPNGMEPREAGSWERRVRSERRSRGTRALGAPARGAGPAAARGAGGGEGAAGGGGLGGRGARRAALADHALAGCAGQRDRLAGLEELVVVAP